MHRDIQLDNWTAICSIDDIVPNTGVAALINGEQVAVFRIPGARMQHDLVDVLVAGQQRREQHAVVVPVRLGAEDGDLVQVRSEPQELLDRAHAGHAVADDDQARLHDATQTVPFSTRTGKLLTECAGASRHSPVCRSKWCL